MVLKVLRQAFKKSWYLVTTLVIAIMVFTGAILLPNYEIILQVLFSTSVSFFAKLSFVFSLYGSLATNFTSFSAVILIVTSLLFGINISLLIYYIKSRQAKTLNTTSHLATIGGMISAIFGIGCAACGSVIFTAVLGAFGAGSFILLLPYKGAEFGLLGIFLLGSSVYYLSKKINNPLICRAD